MSVLEGHKVDQQHLLRTLFLGNVRSKENKRKAQGMLPHILEVQNYLALSATILNSFLNFKIINEINLYMVSIIHTYTSHNIKIRLAKMILHLFHLALKLICLLYIPTRKWMCSFF